MYNALHQCTKYAATGIIDVQGRLLRRELLYFFIRYLIKVVHPYNCSFFLCKAQIDTCFIKWILLYCSSCLNYD